MHPRILIPATDDATCKSFDGHLEHKSGEPSHCNGN